MMSATPRIAALRARLSALGLAGAVISRPENVLYLTGSSAGPARPAFAVVGPHDVAYVGPMGSTPPSPDVAVHTYGIPGPLIERIADVDRESLAALRDAVERVALTGLRAGYEEMAISAFHAQELARHAGLVPLHEDIVAELRRRKEPAEIARIRAAIACDEAGFAAARAAIAAGVSELEVYFAVTRAVQSAAGAVLDLTDANHAFLSGPRTLLAAGPPSGRRLARGDLMIVDLNPVIDQYKGDLTRTFCAGPPAPAQVAMHDALRRAHEQACRVARPGVPGRAVDAALRQTLVDAGYGAMLMSHFGHGLGLQHLERPYIIPAEEMPLEEGMVIALEPAIYPRGAQGLRLEDNYLVTAHGLDLLSTFPRELIVCD